MENCAVTPCIWILVVFWGKNLVSFGSSLRKNPSISQNQLESTQWQSMFCLIFWLCPQPGLLERLKGSLGRREILLCRGHIDESLRGRPVDQSPKHIYSNPHMTHKKDRNMFPALTDIDCNYRWYMLPLVSRYPTFLSFFGGFYTSRHISSRFFVTIPHIFSFFLNNIYVRDMPKTFARSHMKIRSAKASHGAAIHHPQAMLVIEKLLKARDAHDMHMICTCNCLIYNPIWPAPAISFHHNSLFIGLVTSCGWSSHSSNQ